MRKVPSLLRLFNQHYSLTSSYLHVSHLPVQYLSVPENIVRINSSQKLRNTFQHLFSFSMIEWQQQLKHIVDWVIASLLITVGATDRIECSLEWTHQRRKALSLTRRNIHCIYVSSTETITIAPSNALLGTCNVLYAIYGAAPRRKYVESQSDKPVVIISSNRDHDFAKICVYYIYICFKYVFENRS